MPTPAARRRGGVIRYRTIKRGGKTLTVEIVRKPGPRGGRTIAHERGKHGS